MADAAGAIQGAGQGAATGAAVGGPWGAIIGGGVGLAGALLNRRKNVSAPNLAPVIGQINQGYQTQTGITNALPGKLQPLNSEFSSGISGAQGARTGQLNDIGAGYIKDFDTGANTRAQTLSDLLKQRTLESVPDQEQALREALASTGQLTSGAGVAQFAKLAQDTAGKIAQGQQGITAEQQAAQNQARTQVEAQKAGQVGQLLGIDQDTVNKLYASGRQDLIDQANALIQESQAQTQALAGLYGAQATGKTAANIANASSGNDLRNAIIGAGGQILGGLIARRQQNSGASRAPVTAS